jgi:hypothetical protein
MKKMLLATILMGVMGASCGNAEVSNAQLLAHLKNIRTEIVVFNEEWYREMEKTGQSDIMRDHLKETASEWYNKADSFKEIFTHDTLLPLFDLICKDVKVSFKEIYQTFEGTVGYKSWDSFWMNNQVMKELFELYVPILKRLEEKHPFSHALTDDVISYCFNDVLHGVCFMRVLGYEDLLLKLIDAKIAELEAQV